ncbi:MAG: hypothetical protein ACLP9L_29480 [Thermoguttaceae bacterium]
MFLSQTVGTARRQIPAQHTILFPLEQVEPTPPPPDGRRDGEAATKSPPVQRPLLHLSEAAAAFLANQIARGLAKRTIEEYRLVLWSILEYAGCDPPIRELPGDTCVRYLRWLRVTPSAPRRSKTLPRNLSPGSVAGFFAFPGRRKQTASYRQEQTIGRYWRHAEPFFAFLGLKTEIEDKRDRPNLVLVPPLVPSRKTIRNWWRDALTGAIPPPPSKRRQVVLVQGLVLLTGMRIDEALEALVDDIEGHYLLVRESKTHQPRILYLNQQALGIVAALHAGSQQRTLFDAGDRRSKFVTAWNHTQSTWHALVRECKGAGKHDPSEKRHQLLRRKLATWLHKRDEVVESAQLGHGQGVLIKNYLDVLRRTPRLLEKFRLPALEIEGFAWPAPIDVPLRRPDRLCGEFKKLVTMSRRRN